MVIKVMLPSLHNLTVHARRVFREAASVGFSPYKDYKEPEVPGNQLDGLRVLSDSKRQRVSMQDDRKALQTLRDNVMIVDRAILQLAVTSKIVRIEPTSGGGEETDGTVPSMAEESRVQFKVMLPKMYDFKVWDSEGQRQMRLNMHRWMYENLDSESVDGEMDSYNATRAVSLLNQYVTGPPANPIAALLSEERTSEIMRSLNIEVSRSDLSVVEANAREWGSYSEENSCGTLSLKLDLTFFQKKNWSDDVHAADDPLFARLPLYAELLTRIFRNFCCPEGDFADDAVPAALVVAQTFGWAMPAKYSEDKYDAALARATPSSVPHMQRLKEEIELKLRIMEEDLETSSSAFVDVEDVPLFKVDVPEVVGKLEFVDYKATKSGRERKIY